MNASAKALVAVAALVSLAPLLRAAPVVWPTNGHVYEVRSRPEGVDWLTAQTECVATGGYLATLTTEAENDFVFGLVASVPSVWRWGPLESFGLGPWIGGRQEESAPEPDSGWYWSETGEPWGYENWAPGEPNDGLPNEDFAHFYSGQSGVLIGNYWNDAPGDSLCRGYVYESDGWTAVAEPDSDGAQLPAESSWSWIKALHLPQVYLPSPN